MFSLLLLFTRVFSVSLSFDPKKKMKSNPCTITIPSFTDEEENEIEFFVI